MTTNFPTNLDTFTNPTATSQVSVVDHAGQHTNINDAVAALETKVGIDGSAVTTTHDYKLGEVTGSDKAVGKSATQTLTNKTLTTPVIAVVKPSAGNSLTLPDTTDTLVGKNTTDTLTNKTLTTPTIENLTNMQHDHSSSGQGGQLNATTAFSSGTIPTARLGSGTANSTTYLRGDQTWQQVTTYQTQINKTIAENMDGSSTPVAVCINADGNVQKASANTTGIDKFIGFVTSNVSGTETYFVNTSSSNGSSTLAFVANAGTNRVLLVQVLVEKTTSGPAVNPSSVTYGGNAMTLIDSHIVVGGSSNSYGQSTYYYVLGTNASNDASQNIVVVGGTYSHIAIIGTVYANVDQSTPVPTKAKATGASTTASVSLDPAASFCKVINFLNCGVGSVTWNNGQTSRDSQSTAASLSQIILADVTNSNGANTTYTATVPPSGWGIISCELKPSPVSNANITFTGLVTTTGLAQNATYYLSNTAGQYSTSAGTTSIRIGKAISTTQLLITH